MRTPLVLLAITAAALGPAATAAAKEIASVKVCGADGCTDVTDRTSMAIADGGPPTAWPDAKTPFYRVKIAVKAGDGRKVPGWSFRWVPAAQKIQFEDGTWGNPPSTTMDETFSKRSAAAASATTGMSRRSRMKRIRPPD